MLDIKKIKVLLKLKGMTQSDLADSLHITQSYLSYILSGKRRGSIEIIANIAKALGTTVDDIVVASSDIPLLRKRRKRIASQPTA